MELYYFYQIASIIVMLAAKSETLLPLPGLLVGLLIWAIVFILQGVGLYKMAKNRGMKNKALAFVPFANIWFIGKLAGECHFFGQKMKRAGTYTMIMQIVASLLCFATIASEVYLWTVHGTPQMETSLGMPYWGELSGFSGTVYKFYDLSGYLLSIAQLVYEIFLVILVMGLYKKYEPKNYMFLSMLTLFVPASRFIIVFAIRNRNAVDYEAYMRARREAYMRRQQQYYNQYNNPYNNPYNQGGYNNPYGQNPYGQNNGQSAPRPEEPFSEFSSASASKETSDKDGNSDEFFN